MEYNTARGKLIIPEYGRNLQKLVNYATTIGDREKRNKLAKQIISIMGQMRYQMHDVDDIKRKLWDHLYIISDFKLDVDSPFPPPDKQILYTKPSNIPYQDNEIKYRHYGKNITLIIQKAIEYKDGPEKDALVEAIANHLKKSYLHWNKDSVNDELINEHLSLLSDGKLKLNDNAKLNSTSEILARNRRKKYSYKQRDNSSGTRNHNKDRKKRDRKYES